MKLFKCPHSGCGKIIEISNDLKDFFCPGCGKYVLMCPNCLMGNKIGALFCRSCRKTLKFNAGAEIYSKKVNNQKNSLTNLSIDPLNDLLNDFNREIKYSFDNNCNIVFSGSIASGYGYIFFITRNTDNSQIYFNAIKADSINYENIILTISGLQSTGYIEIFLLNGNIFLHDRNDSKNMLLSLKLDITKLSSGLKEVSFESIFDISNKEYCISSNIVLTHKYIIAAFYNKKANKSIVMAFDTNNEKKYKILAFDNNEPVFNDYFSDKIHESSLISGEIKNILYDLSVNNKDFSYNKINFDNYIMYFTSFNEGKTFYSILRFNHEIKNINKIKFNEFLSNKNITISKILCYSEDQFNVLAWVDDDSINLIYTGMESKVSDLKKNKIDKSSQISFISLINFNSGQNSYADYIITVSDKLRFLDIKNVPDREWVGCLKRFEDEENIHIGANPRIFAYNNALLISGNRSVYLFYIDQDSRLGVYKRFNCASEVKTAIYYGGTIFAFMDNFCQFLNIANKDTKPDIKTYDNSKKIKISKDGFYELNNNSMETSNNAMNEKSDSNMLNSDHDSSINKNNSDDNSIAEKNNEPGVKNTSYVDSILNSDEYDSPDGELKPNNNSSSGKDNESDSTKNEDSKKSPSDINEGIFSGLFKKLWGGK